MCNDGVLYVGLCYVWCIQSHMYGWLDCWNWYWNCNKFISHFNSLNAELNPICHLLALLGTHHILHISRIRVKQLYQSNINVFYYVHWIGLCTEIIVLSLYMDNWFMIVTVWDVYVLWCFVVYSGQVQCYICNSTNVQ